MRLADERRWGEAAAVFARLATVCDRGGYRDGARWAWDAAGEAWRRDDHPAAAARALRMALAIGGDDDAAYVARVKLAGVLVETGELHRAAAACERVLEAASGRARYLALDTLASVLQAQGQKEAARRVVADLAEGEGPNGIAARFREGQLARLDGRLVDGARHQAWVIDALEGVDGGNVGRAAARAELAELALLRGDVSEAVAFFDDAVRAHDEAGRASLAARAAAGRVRAAVEAGLRVLPGALDEALATAEARGMVVAETDLCIARGMARSEKDTASAARDLDRAAELADRVGMPFRAGRARLERATRVPASAEHRLALLDRALAQLDGSAPLAARALLARAEASAASDPSRARAEAVHAAARFGAMGMHGDVARSHELIRDLG